MHTRFHTGLVIAAVAVVVASTSCTDDRGAIGGGASGNTLVLSPLIEPQGLDPALGPTIVSLQITNQLFETLVRLEPGGTRIVPALARSWQVGDDGTTWTFHLQRNVRFHDGTPFDAGAVCANFERWHNFRGVLQSPAGALPWRDLIGGFAHPDSPDVPKDGLYAGCELRAPDEVVLRLTRPSGAFLSILAVPAFAIASPTALRRYEADKVSGGADQPRFEGTFGTAHPIGTGPFRFQRWVPTDRLVLVRNDDYWGEKAALARLVYRPLPDGAARRQALENGDIDGYDPVDPPDVEPLRRGGFTVLERPPLNVAFVGMNQAKPPLDNLDIRRAVAHALDRNAVVRAHYPPSALVADQFLPPTFQAHAPDVPRYPHDPERARRLIAESGVKQPRLEFWYATDAPADPGVPDPPAIFEAFRADLEEAGFNVVPRAVSMQDYYPGVLSGQAQLFLDVEHGIGGHPDAIMNAFQRPSPMWGFDTASPLRAHLERSEAAVDESRSTQLYREAGKLLMELLPAVPFVHVQPATALSPRVEPYPVSPTPFDHFARVRLRQPRPR